MKSVEMHGMWVIAAVAEVDADTIAFCAAKGGAGDPAVVGPGGKFDVWHDLNVLVDGDDVILSQGLAIRQCGYLAIIKIGQRIGWVEAVRFMVHFSNRSGQTIIMTTMLHHRSGVACMVVAFMFILLNGLCDR